MKKVCIAFGIVAVTPLLFSCATKQAAGPRPGSCEAKLAQMCDPSEVAVSQPWRHLAWLEGDLQTDYEPDRNVAEARLKQWEGKIPEMSDTDRYLEYLSVLDASGRTGDAEKQIKAYLAKNPQEKRALFLLGVHYMRRRKMELATYLFTQLEKDEKFPWKSLVYNNLGMLALQEKNRFAALEYLEKATKSNPPSAAPFVNLGALYLQSRSYVDAQSLFERARSLDGEMEDAVLGLGASFEAQGKFEDAHKLYSQYIDSNPNALSVLYNDALILGNRLKNREQAAQLMLRYVQRGGKQTAKAQEHIQSWR